MSSARHSVSGLLIEIMHGLTAQNGGVDLTGAILIVYKKNGFSGSYSRNSQDSPIRHFAFNTPK